MRFFFERLCFRGTGISWAAGCLFFFPSKETAKVSKMTIDEEFWNKNMNKLMAT